MRWVVLAVVVAGCASSDDEWSEATDPGIAELEDAAALDDGIAASDLVSDDADATEVDDDVILDAPHTYTNAVAGNCADPGVIRDGTTFVAACTGNGFPLFSSHDLVHWTAADHLFHASNKPVWGGGDWWAPEIHHIAGGFVAYFAALSPQRGTICIGAARASSLAGPWTDLGHPLACDRHVSLIDPHVFTDHDGRHFLYYKTDGNGLHPQEPTVIFGHELTADGVHFVGKRHHLIQNTLAWEGDVVEAPWVKQRGGYYYLFYSGFRYCNGTYGVGVARARSPLGPFTKRSAPILHSNATWTGPGHNSVVSTGGHDYIVYHAWHGAHQCGDAGNRELMLDRITWRGGWPFVNSGSPGRGPQPVPAVP